MKKQCHQRTSILNLGRNQRAKADYALELWIQSCQVSSNPVLKMEIGPSDYNYNWYP